MEIEATKKDILDKNRIIIAGDLVTDVFFYQEKKDNRKRLNYNFGQSHHYRSAFYPGGIHFIHNFLNKILNDKKFELDLFCGDKKYITREIIEKFPSPSFNKEGQQEKSFARVPQKFRGKEFLGIAENEDNHTITFSEGFKNCNEEDTDNRDIKLFIINDIGKDFRSSERQWLRILALFLSNPDSDVILKINPEFRFDQEEFAPSYKKFLHAAINNLIIIVNLKDLRLLDSATISY